MKYEIHGADSKTGEDRKIEIEAQNEKAALAIASKQGILTTNIYKIHDAPFQKTEDHQQNPDDIICPNPKCDYRGSPKRIRRGNLLMALILSIFFLLPGLLCYVDLWEKLIRLSLKVTIPTPPDDAFAEGVGIVSLQVENIRAAIAALAFSLPAFLYLTNKSGYVHVCPKCGLQIRIIN